MSPKESPQFTPAAEQPKPKDSAETTERKRPGGVIPEWSLWESRVEQGEGGQLKDKGVRAPDGTYYQLQEGERFVINKGEGGDYEAVIIGQNGEERVLRKSAAKERVERGQQDKEKLAELRKSLGIEEEATGEASKQSQKIFDNIYEQLKPQAGTDVEKAGSSFIDSLAQYQDLHVGKINKDAPVDQSVEKIWTEGMARKLTRFQNDPNEFERRKAAYGEMYLKLKGHIDQLTQSGEVDPFAAKVFLENFRALKASDYYNDIVRNPGKPSEEARERYHAAAEDLYSMYGEDKTIEQGGFYHFNRKGNEDVEAKNRVYLSADLAGSPEKLVSAWKAALTETGLQDKIYFKLAGQLLQRYETIIIYQTEDTTDEEMGKVMEAFQRLCPEDARAKTDMPSSAPLTRGISYAPEPKNLNELFRAMDLKDSEHDEAPMGISYNQMIAGFTRLSFELAYKDFIASRTEKPNPKDLKDGAGKYFEQMVKLAGINPETMVPNAQGGKLPAWAEKLSKERI